MKLVLCCVALCVLAAAGRGKKRNKLNKLITRQNTQPNEYEWYDYKSSFESIDKTEPKKVERIYPKYRQKISDKIYHKFSDYPYEDYKFQNSVKSINKTNSTDVRKYQKKPLKSVNNKPKINTSTRSVHIDALDGIIGEFDELFKSLDENDYDPTFEDKILDYEAENERPYKEGNILLLRRYENLDTEIANILSEEVFDSPDQRLVEKLSGSPASNEKYDKYDKYDNSFDDLVDKICNGSYGNDGLVDNNMPINKEAEIFPTTESQAIKNSSENEYFFDGLLDFWSTTKPLFSVSELPSYSARKVPPSSTSKPSLFFASELQTSLKSDLPYPSPSELSPSSAGRRTIFFLSELPSSTSKLPSSPASELPSSSASEPPTSSASEPSVSAASELPSSSANELPTSLVSELPSSSASELPSSSASELPSSSAYEFPTSFESEPSLSSVSEPSLSSASEPSLFSTIELPSSPASELPSSLASELPSSPASELSLSSAREPTSTISNEAQSSLANEFELSLTSELPSSSASDLSPSSASVLTSSLASEFQLSSTSGLPSSSAIELDSYSASKKPPLLEEIPSTLTSEASSLASKSPYHSVSTVPAFIESEVTPSISGEDNSDFENSAEYNEAMTLFVSQHREVFDANSEKFVKNVAPVHIKLSVDVPTVIRSPGYPDPYPTNNVVDWILEGPGMGIEMNITDFEVNGALGDYLLIKPGGINSSGTGGLVFSYRLRSERKYRFLNVNRMFVRFESKMGMQFYKGFSFSVKMIKPPSEIEEELEEDPSVKDPEETLTLSLAGVSLPRFHEILPEFEYLIADMAQEYIEDNEIDEGMNTTAEVTKVTDVAVCNLRWPNYETCIEVTFGVPLQYQNASVPPRLNAEDLGIMWFTYIDQEPYASRFKDMGLSEYDIPAEQAELMMWTAIGLGVIISLTMLFFVVWRFRCFEDYSRISTYVDVDNGNINMYSDLYPTPHQSLPPLFNDSDCPWSHKLTFSEDNTYSNNSFEQDLENNMYGTPRSDEKDRDRSEMTDIMCV